MDYQKSMKDAFLDYILSDPKNKEKLGVRERILPFPVFVIRAPVSWHQNMLSGKNFMRHNLFPCHSVLWKLIDLWFEK